MHPFVRPIRKASAKIAGELNRLTISQPTTTATRPRPISVTGLGGRTERRCESAGDEASAVTST